jgi:hypothetical protein
MMRAYVLCIPTRAYFRGDARPTYASRRLSIVFKHLFHPLLVKSLSEASQYKNKVVRPSAVSLNSLAEVLRQAQPLYSECRSILNYLDIGTEIVILPLSQSSESDTNLYPVNEGADYQRHSILERMPRNRKSIM